MNLNFIKEYSTYHLVKRLTVFFTFLLICIMILILGFFSFSVFNEIGLNEVMFDILSDFTSMKNNNIIESLKSEAHTITILLNFVMILNIFYAIYQGIVLIDDNDFRLKFYTFSMSRKNIFLFSVLTKLFELIIYNLLIYIFSLIILSAFSLTSYIKILTVNNLISLSTQFYIFGISLIRFSFMKSNNAIIASSGTIFIFFIATLFLYDKNSIFAKILKFFIPYSEIISFSLNYSLNNISIIPIIGNFVYFIVFTFISMLIVEKQKDFDR